MMSWVSWLFKVKSTFSSDSVNGSRRVVFLIRYSLPWLLIWQASCVYFTAQIEWNKTITYSHSRPCIVFSGIRSRGGQPDGVQLRLFIVALLILFKFTQTINYSCTVHLTDILTKKLFPRIRIYKNCQVNLLNGFFSHPRQQHVQCSATSHFTYLTYRHFPNVYQCWLNRSPKTSFICKKKKKERKEKKEKRNKEACFHCPYKSSVLQ